MTNRRNPNSITSNYNTIGGITSTTTTYVLGHAEVAFLEMAIEELGGMTEAMEKIKSNLLEMLRLGDSDVVKVTIAASSTR